MSANSCHLPGAFNIIEIATKAAYDLNILALLNVVVDTSRYEEHGVF